MNNQRGQRTDHPNEQPTLPPRTAAEWEESAWDQPAEVAIKNDADKTFPTTR